MQKREFHQISRLGKPRVWTIEVKGDEIITHYGELGGKLQKVVDVGQRRNVGRSNEVTAAQDAQHLAERAILSKTRDGYIEGGSERATEIDWFTRLPGNLRFYKPDNTLSAAMLKKLSAGQALLTRKRDGEMMVVVKGPDGKVDIYSRRMLLHHHLEAGQYTWRDRFQELARELEGRIDVPNCTILLGDMVLDPEDDGRWQVASFMKSLTPEAEGPLFFYCWDIAFWDGVDLVSTTKVQERYNLIWNVFGLVWTGHSWIVPIFARRPNEVLLEAGLPALRTPENMVGAMQIVARDRGWEGWVVVDPDGEYGDRALNFRGKTDRPGKFCGKLKPSYEDDFIAFFDPDGTVHGMGPQGKWGTGNHRGQVGSVALYQYAVDWYLVYICDCGGGIDDDFRAKYSDPQSYPLVLQVEYTERTYKSAGDKTNALTSPRAVTVRTDKTLVECIDMEL